jgi:acylglycerol lipase
MSRIKEALYYSFCVSLFLILLTVSSACMPISQPVEAVEHSQAKLTEDAFYAADGAKLPLRHWLPKRKPKAVILALHGFNDYSRAFEDSGKFFAAHSVAVYAYDQRGFGAAPMHGIWADQKNLVEDVKECVAQLRKRYPRTPVYVLGESMGGAVTILALTSGALPDVRGVILVAPAVWGGTSLDPLARAMAWAMAHTVPYYTFTGEDLKIQASDNIPMLRAMYYDPLVIKETRADTIYGLLGLMSDAYDATTQMHAPILVLHGDRDEVVLRPPVEKMVENFSKKAQVKYYPNGYHMLLRDLQAGKVRKDILRWIGTNDL